ncbi:hypothetical protein DFJ58DRAFT_665712, partial [Suillus subalutaceus]|uniref:uncharacterized protein n=1 Tax=Suillus subalutaceus TaxID=48586 RepID=UPI001B886134
STSSPKKVVACVFHGSAIVTTSFRLGYRLCTSKFWWEDGWAAIALVFDIICLFGVWGQGPTCAWYSGIAVLTPVNDNPRVYTAMLWLMPMAFTSVLWAARMSTIYPILRIANPRGALRRTVYAIISCFAVMWTALIVQKVLACLVIFPMTLFVSPICSVQADAVSDLMLVITPMYLLRDVGLTRHQRILVTSVFCASLINTAVSIPTSILLLLSPISEATLIFGHVKVCTYFCFFTPTDRDIPQQPATSLVIANLLVIVSFVYRYLRSSRADLDQPAATRAVEFSTVIDLDQLTVDKHWGTAQTSSLAMCTMASTQVHSTCQGAGKFRESSNDSSIQ